VEKWQEAAVAVAVLVLAVGLHSLPATPVLPYSLRKALV